ncbi:MAG: hypothetical protein LBH13_07675 [Cellulomonadaceae bacterium]|jgi:hypothetical protein|nr:hypothetical protein [Cellulomonadaceae bacterium]
MNAPAPTLEQVVCQACGSPYLTVTGAMMTCQSCDSVFTREQDAPGTAAATAAPAPLVKGFYPFAFDSRQAERSLKHWLASGEWAPDDVLTNSHMTSLSAVYVPVYFFDVRFDYKWSAQVRDDDDDPWTKEKGKRVKRRTTVAQVASTDARLDGLSQDSEALASLDYGVVTDFDHLPWDSTTEVLPATISAEAARVAMESTLREDQTQLIEWGLMDELNVEVAMHAMAASAMEDNLHWDEVGNVNLELNIHECTVRMVSVPLYLVNYSYQGQNYTVALDGRTIGVGFADTHPECEDLKNAASSYFKLGWIPVTVAVLAFAIMIIFDEDISRNTYYWLADITGAALLMMPGAFGLGAILRKLFNNGVAKYRTSVAAELRRDPVNFEALTVLERNRAAARKGWSILHKVLVVSTIAAMALAVVVLA